MLNAEISFEDTIDPQGCNCGPDRYERKYIIKLKWQLILQFTAFVKCYFLTVEMTADSTFYSNPKSLLCHSLNDNMFIVLQHSELATLLKWQWILHFTLFLKCYYITVEMTADYAFYSIRKNLSNDWFFSITNIEKKTDSAVFFESVICVAWVIIRQ